MAEKSLGGGVGARFRRQWARTALCVAVGIAFSALAARAEPLLLDCTFSTYDPSTGWTGPSTNLFKIDPANSYLATWSGLGKWYEHHVSVSLTPDAIRWSGAIESGWINRISGAFQARIGSMGYSGTCKKAKPIM